MRIVVWGENEHERIHSAVSSVYPSSMHETIATGLRERLLGEATVDTATFQEPAHGLDMPRLKAIDVLFWWGHLLHEEVQDSVIQSIHERVLEGMGLVILHSGHLSKIFRRLMGTSCTLRHREGTDREVIWTVAPAHPIAAGIPHPFIIPTQEMYGEFFDVPAPDELVFLSAFTGGEVMRSGLCWTRGGGRIFYFGPGHETHPVFHQPVVMDVLANAARWVGSAGPLAGRAGLIESAEGWFET